MKWLCTSSVAHLIPLLPHNALDYEKKYFSDGELYIRLEEDVQDQDVMVIASLVCPADNVIELLLILDSLQRNNARIHLTLTYCSYLRQHSISIAGQALSAQVIARLLQPYTMQQCTIVHVHDMQVADYVTFNHYIPYDFFYSCAQNVDVIVAPDQGSYALAQKIAQDTQKGFSFLEKKRIDDQNVEIIALQGDAVQGNNILLVDDIIGTGSTIVQAAYYLKQQGAVSISTAATHGIFSAQAYDLIDRSVLKHIFVTDTIVQRPHKKIQIVSLSPWLRSLLV